jgi:hypothetical protein
MSHPNLLPYYKRKFYEEYNVKSNFLVAVEKLHSFKLSGDDHLPCDEV